MKLEIEKAEDTAMPESERIANHPLVKKIIEEFDGRIERIIK